MGFIKETYSNGRAGLIVNFSQSETNDSFCATDSVQEAMEHFNLFLDNNNFLRINSESERAMDTLEIAPAQAKDFRDKVSALLVNLDTEAALENTILFPVWLANTVYTTGERIRYNGTLYTVLQSHTSQNGWEPTVATSLFAKLIRETDSGIIPTWEQPGSTNAYMTNDKVGHNGVIYVSLVDNNVWEPGTDENLWKPEINSSATPNWEEGKVYSNGENVYFNEKLYESLIDNNVWSPEDYPAGWALMEE